MTTRPYEKTADPQARRRIRAYFRKLILDHEMPATMAVDPACRRAWRSETEKIAERI